MDLLISLILTIVSEILFFKWFLARASLSVIVANVAILIIPLTAICFCVYSWVFKKIGDIFGMDLQPKSDDPYKKKVVDPAVTSRCEVLLSIIDEINRSDMRLKYAPEISHY